MSHTFSAHLTAIAAGEVTKTNVIGVRKALNADARQGYGWTRSQTAPKVDPEQIGQVGELLREHRPRVTGELHKTGLAQLQSKRYRRQLENVADVVADIREFRLIGFEMMGERGLYATPIYEARDSMCRGFSFINVPWQSGGRGPEVLSGPYRV